MVPSGLYRYFANRDALLTALIVEAYVALGGHADRALAQAPEAVPRPVVRSLHVRARLGC